MKAVLAVALWLVTYPTLAQIGLVELSPMERAQRQASDLKAAMRYRDGLREAVRYVRTQRAIFPETRPEKTHLLSAHDREVVRQFWQRTLDYYLALDSLSRYHGNLPELIDHADRERSFRISCIAFLATYRTALDLITAAERNPALDALLNEPMPQLGLPAKTYDRFKFRFLNVLRAAEFAAFETVRNTLGKDDSAAHAAMEEDASAIWRAGRGPGHVLTLKNSMDVIRKTAFAASFPVQAGIAEWMGDTKVHRVKRSLISSEQIAALPPLLEPGDVLLERREWYLSNIGLPGFWPHAAVYIGTPEDRSRFFDDDSAVREWVRAHGEESGEFEQLLRRHHPEAYATALTPREHGHAPRVIEAISEGVSFTTLEHSADADSLAVLRPRLSKIEKASALLRAFGYVGRPYDFNFDFRTDGALVCTELVFKVYEPVDGLPGLQLPLVDVIGRVATPANEIVRQFDAQYGTAEQQFDLELFLDGEERNHRAVVASLDEFRRSWRRPKWHVLIQDLPPDGTKRGKPVSERGSR